jgi:hypothetical protein
MYYNDHSPAHFHVRYGSYRARLDVESGELLDGVLPRRVLAIVQTWCGVHADGLRENWQRAMAREPLLPIEPLET